MEADFAFTTGWFANARPVWDSLLPQLKPSRVLEVGSYEGASACYVIGRVGAERPLELHCIDTWVGGAEHAQDGHYPADMIAVERRFMHNVALARTRVTHPVDLHVHKSISSTALSSLLAGGMGGHFDFAYIDGSHEAPDVLMDAVLTFQLVRVGGLIAFDDYLWREGTRGGDPLRCPKVAIDAFTNVYARKLNVLQAPLYQLYVQKTAD